MQVETPMFKVADKIADQGKASSVQRYASGACALISLGDPIYRLMYDAGIDTALRATHPSTAIVLCLDFPCHTFCH
jgi:hypothetical protein